MEKAPQTMPRTIDKAEFDRDYAARTQIEAPLRELTIVAEKLRDTKTLLDFDNRAPGMQHITIRAAIGMSTVQMMVAGERRVRRSSLRKRAIAAVISVPPGVPIR